MRRVAVTAFRNVLLQFRIVRHIWMRTGLFPAGRRVGTGSFDDLVERSVTTKARVLTGTQKTAANQNANADATGLKKILYKPHRLPSSETHHYLKELETAVLNGQAVGRICNDLRRDGFRPDIVIGHNGWGETLYVKDVWPRVPLLSYFEFFYRSTGSDLGFEGKGAHPLDLATKARTRNSINLLGLDAADWGQCPTRWQRTAKPGSSPFNRIC